MAFKELSVKDWKEEIENGLEYRRSYGLEESWATLEALYYDVDPSEAPGPNLIASNGDSLLSTLTVPNPKISVRARRGEFIESASVVEAVDNWLITELEIMEAMEEAVLHAFLWGRGILKIGYDSEFGYDPRLDAGNNLGATLSQFDKKGRRIEWGLQGGGRPGMPWVKCVPPHDIVVPWGTRRIADAPWVAHRVVRHVNEVRSDPKYKNVRDLTPVMSMEDFMNSYKSVQKPYRAGRSVGRASRRESSSRVEYMELFEIHDRRDGMVKVLATGSKGWLRNKPDLLQIDGLPFVGIGFVPRTRAFWTTPDAYYLQKPQMEADDIVLQAAKQRRLMALKFVTTEDAFAPEELALLLSKNIGACAKAKEGSDLNNVIKAITGGANMPLYQDLEGIRRSAREMVGFSGNQAGEYESKGRRTATETREVAEGSQLRMGRRQTYLRRGYVTLIRKLNQVVSSFWTLPRVIEVVGEEGASKWITFTGDSLKGEYAYEVSFSSEQLPSVAGRKREALELYAGLAADPTIDRQALSLFMQQVYQDDPALVAIFKRTKSANLPVQVPEASAG